MGEAKKRAELSRRATRRRPRGTRGHRCRGLVGALAVLVAASAAALGAGMGRADAITATPTVSDLGTLPGHNASTAAAISGEIVVGTAGTTSGDPDTRHAFAYDLGGGVMTDLGTLGGGWSEAAAVSGATVVGEAHTGDDKRHAFAYDLGTGAMTDLSNGGGRSVATAVSGSWVVGYEDLFPIGFRGFVYNVQSGERREIGTIADYGRTSLALAVSGDFVVGYAEAIDHASTHAFVYDLRTGGLDDLGTLGGHSSRAVAVSGDIVVGRSNAADGFPHAFAYDLGTRTMQDLGVLPGGVSSSAVAVHGDIVVGSASTASGEIHAFAYDLSGTSGMVDLGTLGGSRSEAYAVDDGIVVGEARTASGQTHAFAYDLGGTSGMVDLGTGNKSSAVAIDDGIAVGYAFTGGNQHAVAVDLREPLRTPTATSIDSSDNPSMVGAEVTYTATVDPAPDGGTVAFLDGDSAIDGCEAQPVEEGTAICQFTYSDPGSHSVTAEYSGTATFESSTSHAMTQDVAYAVRLLPNMSKPSKGGSAIPVKLQLLDANGNNLSAGSISVTVTGIDPDPAPGIAPTGTTFTFKLLKQGPSYQLNVKTTAYPRGTYALSFTAGTDPTVHTVEVVIS